MTATRDFVFTLTTGRSGTQYLAEVLRCNLPDAECHHERLGWDKFGVDTPDLSHMTLFNSRGNVAKVRAFWAQKLKRIAATPRRFYVETSHLLMKAGLVENLAPLTAAGRVHLIVLERDPYATILSFLSRHDFANNGNWWLWYLDPRYPRNLVNPAPAAVHGTEGICLWYIAEIRTRAAFYAKLVRRSGNVVVHRISLEELSRPAGICRLLALFGIGGTPETVVVPPPQNANATTLELVPEEAARLRALIASLPFDPEAMADESIRDGRDFAATGRGRRTAAPAEQGGLSRSSAG